MLLRGTSTKLFKIDGWAMNAVSACVVDNNGTRAACVKDGRAELYVASTP